MPPISAPALLQPLALYWDFENLHASLCQARQDDAYRTPDNRFKVQEPVVDVQAVMALATALGQVCINRAYCNWQYFGRYREALLHHGLDLIQLFPPGGSAKNGADIRLSLDLMEDVARLGHLRTAMVVSGDSDFMPLAQKIKAAGLQVVGVGLRQATNPHWAASCHQFYYYDDLPKAQTSG